MPIKFSGLVAGIAMTLANSQHIGSQSPRIPADTITLQPRHAERHRLTAGAQQVYLLQLQSDRWVYIEINQLSVDVAASVFAPDGKRLGTFDGPGSGIEPVQFQSGVSGLYRVVVKSAAGASGIYTLNPPRVEKLAASLKGRMGQLMQSYDRPGIAGGVIAVVKGGRTVFSRGYGLANIESGAPNTMSTSYHLASISKQFTAFAIALLVSQGAIALTDDIHKYIPELPAYDTPITIQHLLHHTSGLRDDFVLWELAGGRGDDAVRQDDLLRLIFRQRSLNFTPGSEYDYTNSGYLLLAKVVERVSRQPFREWMNEHVFRPIGMTPHVHQ